MFPIRHHTNKVPYYEILIKKRVEKNPTKLFASSIFEMLSRYYSELFPADALLAWGREIPRMELSVRLQEGWDTRSLEDGLLDRNEFLVRHLRAYNADELRAMLAGPVTRADLGGIYDLGRWLGRPLVFDVDEWTPCANCQDKHICRVCWDTQQVSLEMLDSSNKRQVPKFLELWRWLEETGFRDLTATFTGGRGFAIWCWQSLYFGATEHQRYKLWLEMPVKVDEGPLVQHSHMLRLPFTLNTKTGRLCCPITPTYCYSKDCFYGLKDLDKETVARLVPRLVN